MTTGLLLVGAALAIIAAAIKDRQLHQHENAQLKKSLFGARSERRKLPRVKVGAPTTRAPAGSPRRRHRRAAAGEARSPRRRVTPVAPEGT